MFHQIFTLLCLLAFLPSLAMADSRSQMRSQSSRLVILPGSGAYGYLEMRIAKSGRLTLAVCDTSEVEHCPEPKILGSSTVADVIKKAKAEARLGRRLLSTLSGPNSIIAYISAVVASSVAASGALGGMATKTGILAGTFLCIERLSKALGDAFHDERCFANLHEELSALSSLPSGQYSIRFMRSDLKSLSLSLSALL